ncbi:hypothetical protein ACIBKY_50940 [Nonomuraea sp. NPDC050394]|uniref:hypothetical protein n=1 Tax=Nonomuraea sp. NPDC050394 TaxID=3364363 RepID=UPI0037ADAE8B
MALLVYATAADYTAYTKKPAPADIDGDLERASERIDELLQGAVYATDSSEMPVDADLRAAIARATCAQAAWAREVGDPYGVASAFKKTDIGSVRLERASGSDASGPPRHAQDAKAILRRAGLLPGVVIDATAWR